MSWLRRSVSRRRFLVSSAAVPVAFAVDTRFGSARGSSGAGAPWWASTPARPAVTFAATAPRHLAWVWQFRHDGAREQIRDVLAANGMGIVLKAHDGTDWMSKYDDSSDAVAGPAELEAHARYFEDGGVPFHAWGVLKGEDPTAEALLASQILESGARSMTVDLEAHTGFWRGTDEGAAQYGEELRRLQPGATVITSIDARPWEVPRIPMAEFAAFTNAIAPQVYWSAFNNQNNITKYRASGDDPGDAGITSRFALQSAIRATEEFGLPVFPIGDGTSTDDAAWTDFIDEAFASQAPAVSVWRFGVVNDSVWELLRAMPPRPPTYAVQAGDTLGALASKWGTSVDAIAEANGITNPNFLYIGQQLVVPGVGSFGGTVSTGGSGGTAAPSAASSSGQQYTVQPGDSLWTIAIAFHTTVEELAAANQISNTSYIRIGDTLVIP